MSNIIQTKQGIFRNEYICIYTYICTCNTISGANVHEFKEEQEGLWEGLEEERERRKVSILLKSPKVYKQIKESFNSANVFIFLY